MKVRGNTVGTPMSPSKIRDKLKPVNTMQVIDQKRIKAYEEDGGYYFSENNWKAFIGDEASGKFGYNRAYVERSQERGTYGMYALSYNAEPIYNAWYSKAEWAERFAKEHPNETFREPYDNEYPLLDSVVQRLNNGQIVVPTIPIEKWHSASKHYIDMLLGEITEKFIDMRNDVYSGTEGLAYELSEDGTHYISVGLGDVPVGSDIEIAGYCEGLPVTEVGANAFNGKTLASVRIPTTITKFDSYAFGWAGNTSKVYIKDLAKWCATSFESCGTPVTFAHPKVYIKGRYLTDLVIPEGVTKVNSRAFVHWVQFATLTLPSTITMLYDMAFQYCSGLESVTIPASMESMGASSFGYCSNLKSVTFEGTPLYIAPTAFENDTALTDIYVPWSEGEVANAPWGAVNATVHYQCYGTDGLAYTLADDGTYYSCTGIGTATDTKIVIASVYNGLPVKSIGYGAFMSNGNQYRSMIVTIPDSVTTIGDYAFMACKRLTSVSIGKGVTSIGSQCFSSCFYLAKVVISSRKVTSIGNYAFSSTDYLKDIYVPWSEGEVSGAPWGAKNATIHYNSEV